jgi:hypothetical protein
VARVLRCRLLPRAAYTLLRWRNHVEQRYENKPRRHIQNFENLIFDDIFCCLRQDLEEEEEGDAPSRGASSSRISVDAFLAQSKPQGTIEDDTEDVDIKVYYNGMETSETKSLLAF